MAGVCSVCPLRSGKLSQLQKCLAAPPPPPPPARLLLYTPTYLTYSPYPPSPPPPSSCTPSTTTTTIQCIILHLPTLASYLPLSGPVLPVNFHK
ncbi:hypothetical protein K440DRAFT_212602 [Wilcoxina mikolae CBS 423.85]|nr:hypothetical protein K440DRAFT_212602 [Wilcoxina mikolae CBS 423.85]